MSTEGAWTTNEAAAPGELHWEGLLGNDTTVIGLDSAAAEGARFLPYADVLELPEGSLRYLPDGATAPVTVPAHDPGALAKADADRAWLEDGEVPGRSAAEREISARALLDLRLLLQPNGALAGAWWSIWQYAWPRDGSIAAVALARTGHPDEALSALGFFARVQRGDGTWEARYHLDGSPVLDGRRWQLDANGWVPWAVWSWAGAAPEQEETLRELWPTVERAADYAAASLQDNGLPEVSPDYWENAVDAPTIANSAVLLAGLRSAADLGERLDRDGPAGRYAEASCRLEAAIHAEFGPHGYPRTPRPGAGADALVAALVPPFTEEDPRVREAVVHAGEVLRLPNGGILPGQDWRGNRTQAWTAETAMFALAAAATGRVEEADRWLQWIYDHRSALGAFPEKVDPDGRPASVAPVAWADAGVLLSLRALEHPLDVPPDPC